MPYYRKTYRATVPVGPPGGSRTTFNIGGGGGYNITTISSGDRGGGKSQVALPR